MSKSLWNFCRMFLYMPDFFAVMPHIPLDVWLGILGLPTATWTRSLISTFFLPIRSALSSTTALTYDMFLVSMYLETMEPKYRLLGTWAVRTTASTVSPNLSGGLWHALTACGALRSRSVWVVRTLSLQGKQTISWGMHVSKLWSSVPCWLTQRMKVLKSSDFMTLKTLISVWPQRW